MTILFDNPPRRFHAHRGWRNNQPSITNWAVGVLAGRCRSGWKQIQKPIIPSDLRMATVILFCLPLPLPSTRGTRNSTASSVASQAKRVSPMCGWDYDSNLPRSRFFFNEIFFSFTVPSFAEEIFLLCIGTYSWIMSPWIFCLKTTHTLRNLKIDIFRLPIHNMLLPYHIPVKFIESSVQKPWIHTRARTTNAYLLDTKQECYQIQYSGKNVERLKSQHFYNLFALSHCTCVESKRFDLVTVLLASSVSLRPQMTWGQHLPLLSGEDVYNFLVWGRKDNPCWFKDHVPPQNAAWFFTQIEIFSGRNEGWFIRLRNSDEMFCSRDILTHVSDGPQIRPCKLPTLHIPPPTFFLLLFTNHRTRVPLCKSDTYSWIL